MRSRTASHRGFLSGVRNLRRVWPASVPVHVAGRIVYVPSTAFPPGDIDRLYIRTWAVASREELAAIYRRLQESNEVLRELNETIRSWSDDYKRWPVNMRRARMTDRGMHPDLKDEATEQQMHEWMGQVA